MSTILREKIAGALWLNRLRPDHRSMWDGSLAWYKNGADNPASCVHYSTVATALQEADVVLAALATEGQESGEPVAWLHTIHYEAEQTSERVSLDEMNPWGEPGLDYSEEYEVTSKPLYAAPPQESGEMEGLEELIHELAAQRMSDDEQIYSCCGTQDYDQTIEDFLPDARDFVMRCIAAASTPSSIGESGDA